MKLIRPLCFFVLCFFCVNQIQSQDVHFSQYYMSPIILNPALTGNFLGTFRAGGIYRNQYNSINNSSGFTTPAFFVDAPILSVRKKDWLSVGGTFYSDKAGGLSLKTSGFWGTASYNLALDKKGQTYLAVGILYGQNNQKLDKIDDVENGVPVAQTGLYLLNGSDTDLDALKDNPSYSNFGGGLVFKSVINKKTRMDVGFSGSFITKPTNNFTDVQSKKDRRIAAHGRLVSQLNDKWDITPAIMFLAMAGENQISVQTIAGRLLDEEKDITVRGGLGYRVQDAAILFLGMDYKDWRVGLAYDFNVSNLGNEVGGTVNGWEVGVTYIAKIFKEPEVKPIIFCPKF